MSTWTHSAALPVVHSVIKRLLTKHPTAHHNEIVAELMKDARGSELIKKAVKLGKGKHPTKDVAMAMVAWFSQRHTMRTSGYEDELEKFRAKPSHRYTYRLSGSRSTRRPFKKARKKRHALLSPMLFVNIGYMRWYEGQTDDDRIRDGGSYIRTHKTGGEVNNFRNLGGSYYGFIPPSGKVNITRLGAKPKADSVVDVVVVWVAKSIRGSVVVGWYKNATVFRHPQSGNIHQFSAKASIENSKLLDTNERIFRIPRGKGGMGESNKWYADRPSHETLKRRVLQYIRSGKLPGAQKAKAAGVHAWQQNQKKRAQVEEAAMKATENWYQRLEYSTRRVDREKCGWDIEAQKEKEFLRIEVKGLSGSAVGAELTPNEFRQMNRYKSSFHISVVPNALSRKPIARVFVYSRPRRAWLDDEGCLAIQKRVGAYLFEKSLD